MRIQLSLVLLAATQLGATDCGEVLRDSGFDLWCGDVLCSWKIVRGHIERVDTWHAGDSGVGLLGDDAAISQLAPVDYGDGNCIELRFVADVAPDATAQLRIDIYGDGTIDDEKQIPTSHWEPVTYRLHLAKPYTGIRFELAKQGPGRAAFANISAHVERTGCEGLPEVTGGPAPDGAMCLDGGDCESGICRAMHDPEALFGLTNRCTGCDDTTCGPGDVCGMGDPVSPIFAPPVRCEPAGGNVLGELCAVDGECTTGICTEGVCSTCNGACANGSVCGGAWPNGPYVCEEGAGFRQHGEPCATNADCASGACNGTPRKVCDNDGRPCNTDFTCPLAEDTLLPTSCTLVGVTGGTCQ